MKRPNLKFHKGTVWISLAIFLLFLIITLYALNNSAKRHHRNLIPSKQQLSAM